MANINLAPASQYAAAARRRRRGLYVISGVIVVVVISAWVVLLLLNRTSAAQLEDVSQELAAVETEITRLAPDAERIELFERRLQALDGLLNRHVSWEPLLSDLERLLPPSVVLTNVDANQDERTISVVGIAPNIDEVAQVVASLVTREDRPTIFRSAELSQVLLQEEKNEAGEVVNTSYEWRATFRLVDAGALPAN